jgi:hypothetical protein
LSSLWAGSRVPKTLKTMGSQPAETRRLEGSCDLQLAVGFVKPAVHALDGSRGRRPGTALKSDEPVRRCALSDPIDLSRNVFHLYVVPAPGPPTAYRDTTFACKPGITGSWRTPNPTPAKSTLATAMIRNPDDPYFGLVSFRASGETIHGFPGPSRMSG